MHRDQAQIHTPCGNEERAHNSPDESADNVWKKHRECIHNLSASTHLFRYDGSINRTRPVSSHPTYLLSCASSVVHSSNSFLALASSTSCWPRKRSCFWTEKHDVCRFMDRFPGAKKNWNFWTHFKSIFRNFGVKVHPLWNLESGTFFHWLHVVIIQLPLVSNVQENKQRPNNPIATYKIYSRIGRCQGLVVHQSAHPVWFYCEGHSQYFLVTKGLYSNFSNILACSTTFTGVVCPFVLRLTEEAHQNTSWKYSVAVLQPKYTVKPRYLESRVRRAFII